MSKQSRKIYDAEFKRRAVGLASDPTTTDAQIERDLGLYQGAIRHWRAELYEDPAQAFPGKGKLRPDDAELRRLRRENEILRQERDILKKAVAIFSIPPKTGTGL